MNETETYILFELAGATYGVRSDEVHHLDMLEHLTPVPNALPALDGVVFSRGEVVPALNLRARFGLPRQPSTLRTRLIFLHAHGRQVALIVDAAREFHPIARSAIRPVEHALHGIDGQFVRGLAHLKDRMVLLLDVAAVLRPEETVVPTAVAAGSPA